MKLSKNLNDLLNLQVTHEFRNMLIYKQIEAHFESLELKNIAKYFGEQAQHEKEHGDKFLQHINDRIGGIVQVSGVDFPQMQLSEIDAIADTYVSVEEETTASIEKIYQMALQENSFIDLPFLLNMLNEQVEEEDSANYFSVRIRNVRDLVLFDATFGG